MRQQSLDPRPPIFLPFVILYFVPGRTDDVQCLHFRFALLEILSGAGTCVVTVSDTFVCVFIFIFCFGSARDLQLLSPGASVWANTLMVRNEPGRCLNFG